MRAYFLTLRVDNLPEIEKRQYENECESEEGRVCLSMQWCLIWKRLKRENLCHRFMQGAFRRGATSQKQLDGLD
ncbi:MAG: hypothetical protein ACLQDM_00645 [Bradyrhizobium sp.]